MEKVTHVLEKVDMTALTQSFQSACSNEDFKNYIYRLGLSEEVLKKYTSSLEDSFQEYTHCIHCKNLETCKNKVLGYCYTPEKDGNIITFSYIACKKKQEELEKNSYKNNLELFDMPIEITEASLTNIYRDDKARLPIIKYFKEFVDKYFEKKNPKGLYLTGSFGSGKTYMIAALFNEMAKKGIPSVLIYYPEFLRSLKASFQTNYTEKFDYIKKVPLLLLDDIGAESCSNWSRDEVLGPILQYRMDSHLPTFFTSNLTLDELENSLSMTNTGVDKVKARRIIERIRQLTETLELVSKNRRD